MKSKMKHPNNLHALRKNAGLTQENIASVWGVHRGDVSRIERGEHSITTAKRELLTKHFGWSASQILDTNTSSKIPICGLVIENGAVQQVAGATLMGNDALHDSTAEINSNCEFVDIPPGEYPHDLACVRVDGHSMHPVFKDGEYLFYRRTPNKPAEFLGKDCVVKLADGRIMLKTIKEGRSYGHFDIDSYNQPPIENVEIAWASPIEWVKKVS